MLGGRGPPLLVQLLLDLGQPLRADRLPGDVLHDAEHPDRPALGVPDGVRDRPQPPHPAPDPDPGDHLDPVAALGRLERRLAQGRALAGGQRTERRVALVDPVELGRPVDLAGDQVPLAPAEVGQLLHRGEPVGDQLRAGERRRRRVRGVQQPDHPAGHLGRLTALRGGDPEQMPVRVGEPAPGPAGEQPDRPLDDRVHPGPSIAERLRKRLTTH